MPPLKAASCLLLLPGWVVADEGHPLPSPVVLGSDDINRPECPREYEPILDYWECRAGMAMLPRGDPDHFNGYRAAPNRPHGCFMCMRTDDPVKGCNSEEKEGVWMNTLNGPPEPGDRPSLRDEGVRRLCKRQTWSLREERPFFVGGNDTEYWHTTGSALPGSFNMGLADRTCHETYAELHTLWYNFRPSHVIVNCGETEIVERCPDGVCPGVVNSPYYLWNLMRQLHGDMQLLYTRAHSLGIRVILFTIPPKPGREMYHHLFEYYNDASRELATQRRLWDYQAEHPSLQLIDSYKAFFLMGNPSDLYAPAKEHDTHNTLSPFAYHLYDEWVRGAFRQTLGCVIFTGAACQLQKVGAPVIEVMNTATRVCEGTGRSGIDSAMECMAASALVSGKGDTTFRGREMSEDWPSGCYVCLAGTHGCEVGTWFNQHPQGMKRDRALLYCQHMERVTPPPLPELLR